ncbi:pilus assembly protein TadG-related protein [Devosia sp. XJ19-1]|uniref:Pilus assembly protein TadG-related protein n=1 Tax=Devosia ureilytica TaxID=2952754 RepID=A0A9Q4AN07_9HYPH|nr:pilus assembly protein TadG-related protein [Devosia ureilytica]MCP8883580.1 pilus assembly protein TadG-related protein [Devosia ureilytica]MCP8887188.1 pilus assembly protein TadG-related protein [Devosia ureilytica]
MNPLRSTLDRFSQDEDGVALVFVTILLPVIVGFALLAVDMARAYNLHNDLQKAADAFALAAAAELDGREDSIARANDAIANLLENQSRFSDSGTVTLTEDDVAATFHASIPVDDSDSMDGWGQAGPDTATYVRVVVNDTDFTSIFPASFLGSSNTLTLSPEAVAGFTGTVVCEMTPLFICNPFEGMDVSFHEIVNDENFFGRGLRLVSNDGGSGGAWGPGNFGFLRPQEEHGYGAQDLASDIARSHLRECVSSRGLYFRTGGPQPAVRDAINVRFDIYGGSFKSDDVTIPPAPNVRKGYQAGNGGGANAACNTEEATDLSLYRHFTPDTAYPDLGGKLGNGLWDYEGYLAANNFSAADMAAFVDADGAAYSNANPPSRYDLYIYEIENNLVSRASLGGETGAPACSAAPAVDSDRRLIYGALVNCLEQADQLNGASGESVPAVGYASFFLTEPVSQARTGGDIRAEIVDIDGIAGRGTMENFSRDQVQLYR